MKKRMTLTIMMVVIIGLVCDLALGKYGGGSGTAEDPYQIWDAIQMQAIGSDPSDWDKCFVLMADIDLSQFDGKDGREEFNIIGTANPWEPFSGVFDGSEHTISNFTHDSSDKDLIGVFGYVDGPNVQVKNLGLINPNVTAGTGRGVGSLAGCLGEGTVIKCYAQGGNVSGAQYVGGLVGSNNRGAIVNCYSSSNVTGNSEVGGLLATIDTGGVLNCYSVGGVAGVSNVGGLVGLNDAGEVTDSFWDIETSGQNASAAGIGKTTAEMQMLHTFSAWGSCDNEAGIWTVDDGKGYPRLWWQNMPGEPIAEPSYGGGNGEPNDPYLIYTAEQLNTIGLIPCHSDKNFKLMADIDLNQHPEGRFNIITVFGGVFDGNDHTISDFSYTSASTNDIGLFGRIDGGQLKNLKLQRPIVDAGTGDNVGLLVGNLKSGAISNCHVEDGMVQGEDYVGGLVGNNGGGAISQSSSPSCSVTGATYVGGLVGRSYDGATILNCFSSSNVTGNANVGGLLGSNHESEVINSHSIGSVIGVEDVGGLVGGNNQSTIANCYSVGAVTGITDVGGLVGLNDEGEVTDSFWDIETSGQDTSAGGTGKTTAEMQMSTTFLTWTSIDEVIWTIEDGNGYPHFLWEDIPGDPMTTPSYSGGSGEPDDPYLIGTAEQLNTIGLIESTLDRHFKLTANIDLSEFTGTSFNTIGTSESPFTGVFDGAGNVILNLTIDTAGDDRSYLGLFGQVSGVQAQVKNLGLENVSIIGGSNSNYLGGLCGSNGGVVSNCYSKGAITGGHNLGGLCGANFAGTVKDCYAFSSIAGVNHVGGLCGQNSGTITRCYAVGPVTGDSLVGGLCGSNDHHVYCSFWDIEASGILSSAGGVGKNTAEMMDINTYTRWEDDTWTIDSSNAYPHLAWEGQPGFPVLQRGGSCNPSDPVLLGSMHFYYEYGVTVSSGAWSPEEKSLEGASLEYGGYCRYLEFSWRVNGQPIMSNRGYSSEELIAFLTTGGNEHISFHLDWPTSSWDMICGFYGIASLRGYDGNSGLKNQILTTANTYGSDLAGYEIAELKVTHDTLDYDSWRECSGFWECWECYYYSRKITVEIYGTFLPFFAGSGTEEDPYQIWTAEEMNEIGRYAAYWDKHFILMADIDLSSYDGKGGRPSFNIIAPDTDDSKEGFQGVPFIGVFDGNGHTVSGFALDSDSLDYVGLFGQINGGEIRNLGLIGPRVSTENGDYVGSLVGYLNRGSVYSCYVDGGSVIGYDSVGGLAGRNSNKGTITECYSITEVSGNSSAGGLVGFNDGGIITNSYASSSVVGYDFVGGLAGRNSSKGTITECYTTGIVSGSQSIGGLVGENHGSVTNSYSSGTVNGNDHTGGLVGSGPGYSGGCYWDIESSGQATSAGGTGKNTAEMITANTFVHWGTCGEIWTIDEGVDYPRLWWENKPGEIVTAPRVRYGGGSGEPDDPYLIQTAQHLHSVWLIPCDWDKDFKLIADIDLSQLPDDAFNMIGIASRPFTGIFNGNGHTISNLACGDYSGQDRGLFGYVDDGEIRNLGLIDPNVDGRSALTCGSLVGRMDGGTIANCYVQDATVMGDGYVGGLVGYGNCHIKNCSVTGSVFGVYYVGGLAGQNDDSVANCWTSGNVTGSERSSYVGGLCGLSTGPSWGGSEIRNCYSTATVSGRDSVGGLVGHSGAIVTGSYTRGSVTGAFAYAGLIGWNGGHGNISNCYSASNCLGETGGGLVGWNLGLIDNSYWDIDISGTDWSDGGVGLSSADMQNVSTFADAGWDLVGETVNGIEDIWFIPQQDYPHLWWEGVQVSMKLTPSTLNYRSEGNWIKARLTLPEGLAVLDLDPDRPVVLHSLGSESTYQDVSVNDAGLVDLEATFERDAVCSLAVDWPEELSVVGFLTDGNIFLGTSTVRIITPGMKEIEEFAMCWLNTACDQPDLNGNSMVNFTDYALFLKSQIEFVND